MVACGFVIFGHDHMHPWTTLAVSVYEDYTKGVRYAQ